MINVEPGHLEEVKRILESLTPGCEAWAFGSRVTGKNRKYSDLDVALVGEGRLDWRLIEAVKDAMSESDVPFTVDIVDYAAAGEGFRRIILGAREMIHAPAAKITRKA
jgi:predicted nucleotidyltransferase